MLSSSSPIQAHQNQMNNQTTVVLPPYFFGGSSAGRSVTPAAQRRPFQKGMDKELFKFSSSAVGSKSPQAVQKTEPLHGPPLRSIMDDIRDGSIVQMTSSPYEGGDSTQPSQFMPSSFEGSDFASLIRASQTEVPNASMVDPFYTQGEQLDVEKDLDERCITVFGFDASTALYILEKFNEYGTISNYEISPEGNWMHIMYQSRGQASLALGKSGKIFGQRVKVGVERCIDKEAIRRFRIRAAPSQADATSEPIASVPKTPIHVDTSLWSLPLRSEPPDDRFNYSTITESYAEDSKRLMRSMIAPAPPEDEDVPAGPLSRVWAYLFG